MPIEIGARPLDAFVRALDAAKEIAAADDDRDLHSQTRRRGEIIGDALQASERRDRVSRPMSASPESFTTTRLNTSSLIEVICPLFRSKDRAPRQRTASSARQTFDIKTAARGPIRTPPGSGLLAVSIPSPIAKRQAVT